MNISTDILFFFAFLLFVCVFCFVFCCCFTWWSKRWACT